MKLVSLFFFVLFLFNISLQYGEDNLNNNSLIKVEFNLILDKDIYGMSDFGEAPQIAVWIRMPGQKNIITLSVTRRTARNIWKGKIDCPTSLPIWKSHTDPELEKPDAFSSATPKNGVFRIITHLKKGLIVDCYIEVNVSGDFNRAFPYRNSNGMPDPEINGQPSLIYYGKLICFPEFQLNLKLIGRSDQWLPINHVISDLKGITSAKKLIKKVWVKCFKKK